MFILFFAHHFPCFKSSSFLLVFPSSFIFCFSCSWVLKFCHLHQVQNSQVVSCLTSSYSWCLSSPCCFWHMSFLCCFCHLFFELIFFWFVGCCTLHCYGHLLCVRILMVIVLLLVMCFNGCLFIFWRVLSLLFVFSLLLLAFIFSLFCYCLFSPCYFRCSSFLCSSCCSSSPCYSRCSYFIYCYGHLSFPCCSCHLTSLCCYDHSFSFCCFYCSCHSFFCL